MRGTIGVLFSDYKGKPLFLDCRKPRCRRGDAASLVFHYTFPRWAFQRAISLTCTLNVANGTDWQIAFRTPRVLQLNEASPVYAILRTSGFQELNKYMDRMKIKPFDLDDKGRSLAHVSTYYPGVGL